MDRRRQRRPTLLAGAAVLGLATGLVRPVAAGAQSLEEQTRRPPGSSSLGDDSDRMRDAGPAAPTTDSLDDDSQDLRGRTADQQNPTNSLDDGSLDGGDQADPGDDDD